MGREAQRTVASAVVVIVLAVLAMFIGAFTGIGPANASDPFADYVTTVTGIAPRLVGVTAVAASNGADIVVTNSSRTPLIVLGYQQEPYLKVTNAGVWQNQLSPATYLNKELYIDNIPPAASADKPPVWKQISTDSRAQWHDHRIHWMGAEVPPSVAEDPHHTHLIKKWTIGLEYGSEKAVISGTLTWHPGQRFFVTILPWALVVGATVTVIALMLVSRRRRAGAPPAALAG
ncbi:MAG: hypothetical protein JWQ32_2491 [Marmoricola sp.]|nr:hypothetical protein [Marmoricola sp.]